MHMNVRTLSLLCLLGQEECTMSKVVDSGSILSIAYDSLSSQE